jgi:glycerophosphoryl diester phosphodiesterase
MLLRVGHRGAAGHAPENTLRSVERAIELGVDLIELDVQSTKDGHLVIMHDKRIGRTTNGTGYVSAMTLDELRRFTTSEGDPIPTLEKILQLAGGRVRFILEIISPGIGQQVVETAQAIGCAESTIYASFLHRELLEVRAVLDSANTMALLEGVPIEMASFAKDAKASSVGVALDSVTPEFVAALQSSGLQVFVYTVNHPLDIDWVKSLGVDGIISDFPERI